MYACSFTACINIRVFFCVWMHPFLHIALRLKQMKGDDELESVFDRLCAMNVT